MKVLHVPYCYYPDPVGGTEVYVAALAKAQRERGFDAAIAAPGDGSDEYFHDSARVFRFGCRSEMPLNEFYGHGDIQGARQFAPILDTFRPHILHLHARTQAVSVLLARAAKARGIPTVFTFHTPTVTCAQGTMLRWEKEVCPGEMQARQCAPCVLHSKGLPQPVAVVVGRMPGVGKIAGAAGLEGRVWTALRSSELIRIRHRAVRQLFDEVDHICAVCEWVRDVLVTNGVPRQKITLSRQGVPYLLEKPAHSNVTVEPGERDGLRLAFLGRVDPVKGMNTAISAISRIEGPNVSLDIFAIAQGDSAKARLDAMKQQCAQDKRIRFRAPVPASQVVSTLRNFDALLVPSEWLETGPLVVYEAFAAGIPVIGSDLGGIAELVDDGVNGILVRPGSVQAWAQTISRLAQNPGLLQRLKAASKPVRTAEDTARDAAMVYAKVSRAAAGNAAQRVAV